MDLHYKGNTNIKSELTKHLFGEFRKAYYHLKPKIEAHEHLSYNFYVFIENNFDAFCDGVGTLTHITNEYIQNLHEICEVMVRVLKMIQLDDQDKIMLDVVVKTGNYLAIILDFITQDTRLRELESRKRKHETDYAGKDVNNLNSNLRILSMLGQEYMR